MPESMFADIEKATPSIIPSANYWLVRTDGGRLFDAFIATSSISIGYGPVRLDFIASLGDTEISKDVLKNEVRKHYPPKLNRKGQIQDSSGFIAGQLLRFCKEMKRNDVVLSPSYKTGRLAAGFIDDDAPFAETLQHDGENHEEFSKRRKIRWVRNVNRATINPNLYKLLAGQQTIIDANAYAPWIDALLYEFFRKGTEFHYVIKVRTREKIRAQEIFGVSLDLLELAKKFAQSQRIDDRTEDVATRINLNSPGDVELWKNGVEITTIISFMVLLINGGGLANSLKGVHGKISLKTDGLLTKLNEFLYGPENQGTVDTVQKKLADLQVESPKQVIELLDEPKK